MTDEHGPVEPDSDAERRRWDMIHRFLDGLSTLPERREVQRLMHDDLSVQRYINAHKKVWSMIGRRMGPKPIDQEDAWESLQDRIAEHDRQSRFSLPGRGLEHLRVSDGGLLTGAAERRIKYWRTAAAAAAVAVFGVTSFVTLRHRTGQPTAADVALGRGEHPREARLPDGTRVVLAPDSRLHFAIDRAGAHVATLVGEASFSVIHDPHRTFIVRAAGFDTKDLGTEFDVRAYPNAAARVAVKSGSVSVTAAHGATVVTGGSVGNIDPTSGTVLLSLVRATDFDWTSGRLSFADTPLRDVADELGRRYNLDITIADARLAATPVTITIADGTADNALHLLTATVAGLHFTQDGQKVRLFRQ